MLHSFLWVFFKVSQLKNNIALTWNQTSNNTLMLEHNTDVKNE